jgi:hypothetical protein
MGEQSLGGGGQQLPLRGAGSQNMEWEIGLRVEIVREL